MCNASMTLILTVLLGLQVSGLSSYVASRAHANPEADSDPPTTSTVVEGKQGQPCEPMAAGSCNPRSRWGCWWAGWR